MKEISFLKQNSSRWEEIESFLNEGDFSNPAKLTSYYLQISDDLAYSRTRFPETKTTQYLNALAARIHQAVFRNKREERGRIKFFWKFELPQLFYHHHRYLLISFLVFSIAVLIGFASELIDENFVRIILGDHYVDQTIERIRQGNPLGIYGESEQTGMFFGITINNIKVSFLIFVCGMFFMLGTGFLLVYNGIMLGAFHAFFLKYGFFMKSLLVVWIHGTLEISAIIIAGCAGFVLGGSFMYPGTYPRNTSFLRGAKHAMKIVIGLMPVFIAAGFLESFVTRYTNMPVLLNLLIIFGSLFFIIWYFILLPIKLNKTNG